MAERKKSRPVFSAEQKLAILHMQPLLYPEMPITALCKRVGITPKTYYEWEKAYKADGLEGLKPVIRTPYSAAISSPEVIQGILALTKEHPQWSCTRLHKEIQKRGVKTSRYAFERVLANHGLLTVESRVAVVEQAIIKGEISPNSEELESVFNINPCLADWYRMGERPRYPIGIEAVSLGQKNRALRGHYLVITVDFDSLYVLGILAKARDYLSVKRLVKQSQSLFARPRGSPEGLFIFGSISESILTEAYQCEISIYQESNKYLMSTCLGRSEGALSVIRQKIKETLLPKLKEASSLQAGETLLASWLDEHNKESGYPMYPTFGRKSIDLLSVHTRPLVRSISEALSLLNSGRDFRNRKRTVMNQ
ncbi:helix-turn-helix domain-containing protein [Dechloromonas agitata]|uniref:helix-turn-helix domain-containing protein n=1 Tax=Dechloromonas agitata TaxID=73030 RepID=UPI0004844B8A|nr:helix-turn-helix domain-containing protein [Dechloromonas agitata]